MMKSQPLAQDSSSKHKPKIRSSSQASRPTTNSPEIGLDDFAEDAVDPLLAFLGEVEAKSSSSEDRSPYLKAKDIILGMLSASPLYMWVNFDSFQLYLDKRLPDYVQQNHFDLQQLWDNLRRIPAIQQDALDSFFLELSRQPFPWPVILPRSLRGASEEVTPITKDEMDQAIEKMVDLFTQSGLSKQLDPHKFYGYLKRKLPKFIDERQLALKPIRRALCNNSKVSELLVDRYLRKLQQGSWPWTFLSEEESPKPQKKTEAKEAKPKQPTSKDTLEKREGAARFQPLTNKDFENLPETGDPQSWQLEGSLSSDALDALQPQSPVKIDVSDMDAAADLVLGMLGASPLSMWMDLHQFRGYLQRTLPKSIQETSWDLEPLWDVLNKVPMVQKDAVDAFFEEFIRLEMPWRLVLPRALQQQLTQRANAPGQSSSPQQAHTVRQRPSIPKQAPLIELEELSMDDTMEPESQKNKAKKSKAKKSKALSSQSSPLRPLFFAVGFLLLLTSLGLYYFLFSSPSLGDPMETNVFQDKIPIAQALRHKTTANLILSKEWKSKASKEKITDRLLLLGPQLREQKIQLVRVLSPEKKLILQLDITWSF